MSATRIVAIVLMVGGLLALIYGGFTYTKSDHEAQVGPLQLSLKEKETVNIPVWVGVGGVVVGAALFAVGTRRG